MAKRIFDFMCAVCGLLLLAPLFALISLCIKLDSKGPIFFRQLRIGRFQKPFYIYKFRTMIQEAEKKGMKLTIGRDRRITKCGMILRKYKIDELPQLINVLKGEMSLVGPRPEVPEYVKYYPEHIKEIVFSVRPGITDYASLKFRNENILLASATDPEKIYVEKILPEKLQLYVHYVRHRSLIGDILIILKTLIRLGS